MLTHLLVVRFGPFQRCSLSFGQYPDAATWEEVGGATTGGERAMGGCGDGRANFLMPLTAMAAGKAAVDGMVE